MAVLNTRVPDDLKAAVEARALAERRRPADVVRDALREYLEPGVVAREVAVRAIVEERAAVGPLPEVPDGWEVEVLEPAPAAPALPRRRLARKEMCEHRVPPTSFCKECDA